MKGFSNQLKNSVQNTLAALGCVASLAACSVEATAPPIAFTPPPTTQSAGKAMAAEGTWGSNCVFDQGNYMRETMTLKDNTIGVKVEIFNNGSCAGTPMFVVNVPGTMLRYGGSFYVTGGHDIEVTMTQQDGTTETTRTVFLLEAGKLYLSDRNNGSAMSWPTSVDRSRPFHYVGGI